MARNKYAGICYVVRNVHVSGYGHFERYKGSWRVKSVSCVIGRIINDKDKGIICAQDNN